MSLFDHRWHVLLNKYNSGSDVFRHWMYEAKRAHNEVRRLTALFKQEREQMLPTVHRQCSFSDPVEIKNNFLTCCLGVRCGECPHLMALTSDELTPEEMDIAKAWTCVAHILANAGECDTSEGYVLTEDDKLFWSNVYASMSGGSDDSR